MCNDLLRVVPLGHGSGDVGLDVSRCFDDSLSPVLFGGVVD